MTTVHASELLRSADGVTSPVACAQGEGDRLVLSLSMSSEGVDRLAQLARSSGKSLEDVISKAFILYTEAAEASRKGKAVGIAPTPDVLETQFVGF